MIFNFKSTSDAKTLGGKTADEFAKADHGHTADEVGALSKNGGTVKGTLAVNGILAVGDTTQEAKYQSLLRNAKRSLSSEIDANGNYALWDSTHSAYIINSKADGTNTFNGTASGNLPLKGGGTVYATNSMPMAIRNTNADLCYLQLVGKSGNLGGFGFKATDAPVWLDKTSSIVKDLLHTGNSAKVVISETAPADTSALWVY